MIIEAEKYGIVPGAEIARALAALTEELKGKKGVTLRFRAGDYYIDAAACASRRDLRVTNTVGKREWKRGETPYTTRAAFRLADLEDFTLDGGGARFIARGKLTYMTAENCRGIRIENMTFTAEKPDMHELEVLECGGRYADFRVNTDSEFRKTRRGRAFVGPDYIRPVRGAYRQWWNAYLSAADGDVLKRDMHPFARARIENRGDGVVRARYPDARKYAPGDKFCLFDNRRDNNGIVICRSSGVTMENVSMRFNYGLAVVAQDSEDLTFARLDFTPETGRMMSSVADFLHLCSCRGKIQVTDSRFVGAGDDVLNVHGIHFKIVGKKGNKITVRFMHAQAHGFNPLRTGDTVEFVDRLSLCEKGAASIRSSVLKNEYEIELELDDASAARKGDAIENISACPDLYFARNFMNRIVTRGLLVTTRGKVVVENNEFKSTYMHSLLFSDDARTWWESGRVADVTVRGNTFEKCPMYNVCILPENLVHAGAVHKNFRIENNNFLSYPHGGAMIKSAENVVIENNVIHGDFPLKTKKAANVVFERDKNEFLS